MAVSRQTTEEVIAGCNRAAAANRSTPTREGNVVVLSPQTADDVLVSADLHGDRRNFNRVMEIAALDAHPRRHLVLQEVCHGGPLYPSGTGCMSHLLLEDVARLKTDYPDRVHFILGNHELAELTDYPIVKGGKMLNLLFRCGLQEMYGEAADDIRAAYNEFIGSLPLAVRLSSGIFISHSLPEAIQQQGFDVNVFRRPLSKADLAECGDAFRLVWGRDYAAKNADAFAKLVKADVLLTGHEPCSDGYQVPNDKQVIIDSCDQRGCYVILPLSKEFSHAQIVDRIERIH